mmetsp:Transcript_9342/g.20653  ORF Transcript_9342/g.20653 Transcript_9342/m.20653 type:complete len:206 (-) Transcript_9342:431-1048(-)
MPRKPYPIGNSQAQQGKNPKVVHAYNFCTLWTKDRVAHKHLPTTKTLAVEYMTHPVYVNVGQRYDHALCVRHATHLRSEALHVHSCRKFSQSVPASLTHDELRLLAVIISGCLLIHQDQGLAHAELGVGDEGSRRGLAKSPGPFFAKAPLPHAYSRSVSPSSVAFIVPGGSVCHYLSLLPAPPCLRPVNWFTPPIVVIAAYIKIY